MTNDRAIELLRRLQDEQFDGIHGDERREALEMAIRALEGDGDMISRQAVMKEFSDFVRKSNNSDFAPTPTWNDAVSLVGSMPSAQIAIDINVGDTIYRQQAIDALNDEYHGMISDESMKIYQIINWISALPSAQPERKTGQLLYHHTEDIDEERTADVYFCSSCKEEVLKKIRFGFCGGELDIQYGFCPICGARLSGENDD